MAALAINGTTIAYDDEGSGEPAFVFIHGWTYDRRSWTPQVEALKASHRCIAVDLRGRGESPPVPPFDINQAVEDIAELIRALGVAPVIVVGHSLGGLTALLLNYRHGELVCGTVIGDAPLTSAAAGRLEDLGARVRSEGTMEAARDAVDSFIVPSTPPEVREYVADVLLNCPVDVAAGMLEGAGVFEAELGAMLKAADQKPFMALWPTRPLGNPDRLREITVFLRQEPIADAGHFFQLEHPAVTSALLRAFVDDVERDPRLVPRD